MSTPQSLTDFFAAWGESDADGRDNLIASAVGSQTSYADPRTETALTSVNDLAAYAGRFAAQAPGAVVSVVKCEERQGVYRATIEFAMSSEMKQTGQYFVELDDAGKLGRMIGFVGTGALE